MGPSHNFVGLYLRNQGICRQSEKNSLNVNISSTLCSHNMVHFSPLPAEIGWRVWGTPANFKGSCVLASLLQRRRSREVNQTLHDVWPSPGLLLYVYIFGGSCPLTEFCQVSHWLCGHAAYSGILRPRHIATRCGENDATSCCTMPQTAYAAICRNTPHDRRVTADRKRGQFCT